MGLINLSILVTGSSGFIGFHLVRKLLDANINVVGIDDMNSYYDIKLKKDRLNVLLSHKNAKSFKFYEGDISNSVFLKDIFQKIKFDVVINLAAQAGVRYSLKNPQAYIESNINGFFNILEILKINNVKHFIFASSSSVYGMNKKIPFHEKHKTDTQVSLYAASKKTNELMAHTYSHLYDIPTTGLRFFTVYGPFGRPDMAYYKFTNSILKGKTIDVYNHGKMKRDFTYISDIVNCIVALLDKPPCRKESLGSRASSSFNIYNIGNNNPITLLDFIKIIENECNKNANINFLPMQQGDVTETYADVNSIYEHIGFKPSTSIQEGIKHFVYWYKKYHNV